MADELGERDLYDSLYKALCSVTHAQTSEARFFITESGFDYLDLDFEMSTLLNSHELSMRTFDCIRKHSLCPKLLKADLFASVRKSFASLHIARTYMAERDGYVTPTILQEFMAALAAEEPRLKKIADLSF
ncbi:hypothetical protein RBB79_08180 [Tunturiibacter empetritectus]|uniref:Uncharacterized protein n=1 Tax=Tunturiibacter lichenicola TaxID=2051959 RepID=A0A852V9A4_9BACT|nr:hypothetical protein [Edaphobacter lichenicola]NYF89518.1 hypothetical protein [Edaphobacter lichenicola]